MNTAKLNLILMPRKDRRFNIPALGEWYNDLLTIDSWINGRTKGGQAQSLLCAKLQEREPRIKERLQYLAQKRGITVEEMIALILSGKAEPLLVEENVSEESDSESEAESES